VAAISNARVLLLGGEPLDGARFVCAAIAGETEFIPLPESSKGFLLRKVRELLPVGS
jgi:hypothetical protein